MMKKLFSRLFKKNVLAIQTAGDPKQIKPAEPIKELACNVCGAKSKKVFSGKVLHQYNINYYFCYECEHLQTEKPYWLSEAYNNAISISDTGILLRNNHFSTLTSNVIANFFNKDADYVEYAGGYGILTRLMRDIGFGFYWHDKYATNIFANGFEYKNDRKVELVTAFEAFEHFENPIKEIESIFDIADNILFSQTLLPYPLPKPNEWWYYCLEHGQHLNFYSKKTFEIIAKKHHKHYAFFNDLHLFSDKKITDKEFKKAYKTAAKNIDRIKSTVKSKTFEDMKYCIGLMEMKRGMR